MRVSGYTFYYESVLSAGVEAKTLTSPLIKPSVLDVAVYLFNAFQLYLALI